MTWTTWLPVTKSGFTGTIYSTWTTTNISLLLNGSVPPLDTHSTWFCTFWPTTKWCPLAISRCWSTICDVFCLLLVWKLYMKEKLYHWHNWKIIYNKTCWNKDMYSICSIKMLVSNSSVHLVDLGFMLFFERDAENMQLS